MRGKTIQLIQEKVGVFGEQRGEENFLNKTPKANVL